MNRRQMLKFGLSTAATSMIAPALLGLFSSASAQALVPAFSTRRAIENSVYYAGNVFSFLADSKATRGSYAMYEVFIRCVARCCKPNRAVISSQVLSVSPKCKRSNSTKLELF